MFELDWHSTINQSNLKTSYWHSDWCGRNRDFFYIRSIGRKRRKNITLLSTGGHGKNAVFTANYQDPQMTAQWSYAESCAGFPNPNSESHHRMSLKSSRLNITEFSVAPFSTSDGKKERPTAQWDTCHNQSISSLTNWYVIRSNNPLSQNAWRHLGKTWLRRWRYGHISHE